MKNDDTESFGIKEIAKRARVSIATIDRVIHNRPGVSEETKRRVQAIIKEVNYKPNIFARRLASKKILQFATLIPRVSQETDFWVAPLKGIEQAEVVVRRYGIKVDKYFFDLNNKSSFVESGELIFKTKYDGILVAPSFIDEAVAFSKRCDELGIPYVYINSDIPFKKSFCYIGPDHFRTGYLIAQLMSYLVNENDKILAINISEETNDHLLRKEEGFKTYFSDHKIKNQILETNIRQTDYTSIKETLAGIVKQHHIKAMFVTNSRTFYVARFLEEAGLIDTILIGYDFIEKNITYLDKGIIDFLICVKPQEQGYRGIMTLYNSLVHSAETDDIYLMPIDIITKENYKFYRN